MSRYSAERKGSVIQKMMPPHNIPIPRLAEETGILVSTCTIGANKLESRG